jgi:hypothetical protein
MVPIIDKIGNSPPPSSISIRRLQVSFILVDGEERRDDELEDFWDED